MRPERVFVSSDSLYTHTYDWPHSDAPHARTHALPAWCSNACVPARRRRRRAPHTRASSSDPTTRSIGTTRPGWIRRIRRQRRIGARARASERASIGSDRIVEVRSMRSKSAPVRMSVVDLRDGASAASGLTSRRTKTANERKVRMRRGRKDGLRYVRDATRRDERRACARIIRWNHERGRGTKTRRGLDEVFV